MRLLCNPFYSQIARGIVGIKSLLDVVSITAAQVYVNTAQLCYYVISNKWISEHSAYAKLCQKDKDSKNHHIWVAAIQKYPMLKPARLQEESRQQDKWKAPEDVPYWKHPTSTALVSWHAYSSLSSDARHEFVNKHVVVKNRKSDEEVSKVVRKSDDSLIIEDWVSNSEEENVS
ncbi:hypothetical protein Tco_0140463 [Tanacetum coccineum]